MPISTRAVLYLLLSILPRIKSNEDQCTLYMAPSSVHRNILGLFAGVAYKHDDFIGTPEVAIPIVDIIFWNEEKEPYSFFEDHANFMWTAESIGADFEINHFKDGKGLNVAIPGIGSGAEQPLLSNANWNEISMIDRTDNTMEERDNLHPGLGAYSHYFNATLQATRVIPAGMEIFIDVGIEFDDDDVTNDNLRPDDYEDSAEILSKIQKFLAKHEKAGKLSKDEIDELYRFFIEDIIPITGTETVNLDDREDKTVLREKVSKIFPRDYSKDEGSRVNYNDIVDNAHPEAKKTHAWLEENGQCLDGIYSKTSTLPNAGRGAFAKRSIDKDGFVTPAPLLKINDKNWLDMGNKHQQLFLNYCFGHKESSLLLYSYGAGVNFINHMPGNAANAEIRWTNQSYHDPTWMTKSLEDLNHENFMVFWLGFDIVATRRIKADEEIFIDYGYDWQNSWDVHQKNWDTSIPFKTNALSMNGKISHPLLTVQERKSKKSVGGSVPFPPNIMTVCYLKFVDLDEDDLSERVIDHKPVYKFDGEEDMIEIMKGSNLHKCDIIDRMEVVLPNGSTSFQYTVVIPDWEVDTEVVTVKYVPEQAIRFVDKPYSR